MRFDTIHTNPVVQIVAVRIFIAVFGFGRDHRSRLVEGNYS